MFRMVLFRMVLFTHEFQLEEQKKNDMLMYTPTYYIYTYIYHSNIHMNTYIRIYRIPCIYQRRIHQQGRLPLKSLSLPRVFRDSPSALQSSDLIPCLGLHTSVPTPVHICIKIYLHMFICVYNIQPPAPVS